MLGTEYTPSHSKEKEETKRKKKTNSNMRFILYHIILLRGLHTCTAYRYTHNEVKYYTSTQ